MRKTLQQIQRTGSLELKPLPCQNLKALNENYLFSQQHAHISVGPAWQSTS